jgi:hypothetical protein
VAFRLNDGSIDIDGVGVVFLIGQDMLRTNIAFMHLTP